jgi:restriction system protein
MPRRKKESGWEALVELVAVLPWWAGLIGAVVSYFVLNRVASAPVEAVPYKPGQLTSTLLPAIWHGLATAGQYVLPMIFGIGAFVSIWRRRDRRQLVQSLTQGPAADVLDKMTWMQFEHLVGEGFRLQGYTVAETGGGGADGGVDLVLRRGREKFLVQCKQWRAFRVGVDVVRELYGVMAASGAAGGFVVTSGRFTDEAVDFAQGRNVVLVDGPKLLGLIRQAQAATSGAPAQVEPTSEASALPDPSCPTCSKPMTRRTARRGANAGAAFWGCTGYPACKGTRSIERHSP